MFTDLQYTFRAWIFKKKYFTPTSGATWGGGRARLPPLRIFRPPFAAPPSAVLRYHNNDL